MDERTKETIISAYIRGATQAQIAKQLGYSKRHIITILQKEMAGREDEILDARAKAFRFLDLNQRSRIRGVVEFTQDKFNPTTRLKAFEILGQEEDRLVKRLQMRGILPKEKAEVMNDNRKQVVIFELINPNTGEITDGRSKDGHITDSRGPEAKDSMDSDEEAT